MANAIDLYRHLGVRQIYLTAGLTAGSAVWPKLGFRPRTPEDWMALRKVVLANLAGLDPAVGAAFEAVHGRSLAAAVDTVVATDDPRALFDLLDMDPGNAAAQAAQPKLEHGIAAKLLSGATGRGCWNLMARVASVWKTTFVKRQTPAGSR